MELIAKSKAAKLVLIALEIVVFLPITFWVGKTYFAAVVSRRLDAESLRLATRLDPDNSDYHLKLGRIYQYSLTDINSAAALGARSLGGGRSLSDAGESLAKRNPGIHRLSWLRFPHLLGSGHRV